MVVAAHLDSMKLSERARARHIEHNEMQQSFRPHDIRRSVPLVDYTDPSKFPPYQYREYPKMPLLDGNRPIRIDETGTLLTFYDKEDEEEFRELNPDIADEIDRNTPSKTMAEALAAKDEELSELREKLRAAGIEPPEKNQKRNTTASLKDIVKQAEGGDAKRLPDALKK